MTAMKDNPTIHYET